MTEHDQPEPISVYLVDDPEFSEEDIAALLNAVDNRPDYELEPLSFEDYLTEDDE